MSDKKPICIDFDGVLNTYGGWKGPGELYEPLPGAKEFLEKLSEYFQVIIFTTREKSSVELWMMEHNMYFDKVTHQKIAAVAYVDDRAVNFSGDFEKTFQEVITFKTHWE